MNRFGTPLFSNIPTLNYFLHNQAPTPTRAAKRSHQGPIWEGMGCPYSSIFL
jgi:hypothetical protein